MLGAAGGNVIVNKFLFHCTMEKRQTMVEWQLQQKDASAWIQILGLVRYGVQVKTPCHSSQELRDVSTDLLSLLTYPRFPLRHTSSLILASNYTLKKRIHTIPALGEKQLTMNSFMFLMVEAFWAENAGPWVKGLSSNPQGRDLREKLQ